MIEINVRFQEKYKQLDAVCKDMFSSKDGVSRYIYEMENAPLKYRQVILGWDSTYRNLKHLRWLRNQLAHEVGAFESNLCTVNDIEMLDNFFNSVMKSTDPLAVARKMRIIERKENGQQKKLPQNNQNQIKNDNKQNKSFMRKLIEKLKSIFR